MRIHLPPGTVRLRLTLLYGGLFLASGALLLAVTYALVVRAVDPPPTGTPPPGPSMTAGMPGSPGAVRTPGDPQPGSALSEQLRTVMRELLINSGIALGLMSGLSLGVGWLVAGRILRPLRTITDTARDISATSLHRRLALDGPDDELKRLGDTVDSLLDRLDASFRAQRQFVANASHELRTPLARQRVLGQLAISDPDATPESLRQAHERILAAGRHQERLIEALLTLSRGQTGIDVHEAFDLARPAQEVADARTAEAAAAGVLLRTAIRPAPVTGHRSLAERLIVNLVENALRYNVSGGWVEVRTGTRDGCAVLTVSNTGPVVPPGRVGELFEPFRRLDATRSAGAGGAGLGLSIVHAIADAHHARIVTVARPEGGLTVEITFPGTDADRSAHQ